ncbi:MAG: hydroxymethylbilane synthase [Chloroflexi bacterium]|nr:hydroxymethylbilane synthase [Chloroflexota bacterium]
MVDRVIRVGTRASALARVQTQSVVDSLLALGEFQVEIVPITTGGDRSQSTNKPTDDWGTGVFVKELEAALLREDIDIAVHSLKDLPPLIPTELTLAAFPIREDPLDVLVTTGGVHLDELEPGARVGTSSARRVAFLRAVRPDLQYLPIRGNVETRLRKMTDGEYSAVVLASAGLRRLDLEVASVVLEPELLPPAPGQGALAIQARAGDREILGLVEPLHDPVTAAAVRAERRLMALLDGGCRLPVGALATPEGTALHLLGGYAADQESIRIDRVSGDFAQPEIVAETLAQRLQTRTRVHV